MIRGGLLAVAALAASPALAAPPAPVELTAPGPEGPLAGTLLDPDANAPLVLLIPGSGPTDRDGNNPLGVAGGPYRQLAEALAAKGIATLRIDKRGLFGSKAAQADPNAVTTAAYAADVQAWSKVARARTGRACIWLLGHSEGGLVALQAAQTPAGICGLILVSSIGRPMGAVLRAQLRANPANAPLLPAAEAAIASLEAGKRIDSAQLPAPLQTLFPDRLQGYWIDLLSHDPARLIAAVKLPVLILQGMRDLQVSVADAEALHRAQPKATLTLLPGINHVLRPVGSDDRAANLATYRDATQPISPSIAEAVATFVGR
ncbi:MAG: alpha/beta fold hydrolase [Pseudomonadota bacterium]|jgi:pimeloyl-ACP methyl ester carboxylesterase